MDGISWEGRCGLVGLVVSRNDEARLDLYLSCGLNKNEVGRVV